MQQRPHGVRPPGARRWLAWPPRPCWRPAAATTPHRCKPPRNAAPRPPRCWTTWASPCRPTARPPPPTPTPRCERWVCGWRAGSRPISCRRRCRTRRSRSTPAAAGLGFHGHQQPARAGLPAHHLGHPRQRQRQAALAVDLGHLLRRQPDDGAVAARAGRPAHGRSCAGECAERGNVCGGAGVDGGEQASGFAVQGDSRATQTLGVAGLPQTGCGPLSADAGGRLSTPC